MAKRQPITPVEFIEILKAASGEELAEIRRLLGMQTVTVIRDDGPRVPYCPPYQPAPTFPEPIYPSVPYRPVSPFYIETTPKTICGGMHFQ